MRKDGATYYDYYTFREYRKGDNGDYYQYRFKAPCSNSKIISYNIRWALTSKLTEMGAQVVDLFTLTKGNRRIDVTIYRVPKK